MTDRKEQPFATTQPGANAAAMWKMATSSIYESGDLPVLAMREMVQNSVDAIRASRDDKRPGLIEIVLLGRGSDDLPDKRSMLQVTDNGAGMSSDTFLQAFMVLGVSTKKHNDSENVGGFGMAKAVILGASSTFSWSIKSQSWEAIAENSSDVQLYHRPFRRGTQITIYDWDEREFGWFWDSAANAQRHIKDRFSDTLSANHLPDIKVTLNGHDIHARFKPARGVQLNLVGQGVDWDKNHVEVRKFKHTETSATQFYVRARGLLQFRANTGIQLKHDIVIDVTPTVAPGAPGFPFSASREAFHGKANRTFYTLKEHLRLEAQSLERSQQEELMEPDVEQNMAAEVEAALALQGVLNDELLKAQLGSLLTPTSGTASQPAEESAGTGGGDSELPPLPSRSSSMATGAQRTRKAVTNPLGKLGYVLIQKDVAMAQQQSFRRRLVKFVPLLSFWRLLLSFLMQKIGRSVPFNVGLMLSDKTRAAWEARTPKGIFWVNPVMMLEHQKTYSTIQKWAALWWSTALHELTHALGQMNHNDAFIYMMETLQEQTLDSLPTIELLMKRMLNPQMEETEHPELSKLKRELKSLSRAKLSADERTQQVVKLRQQLKKCQSQLMRESLATAASAELECHSDCSVHEHRASHESQNADPAAALVQQWFEAWWQQTDETQQPALLEAVKARYDEYLAQAREVLNAN